MIQPNQTQLNCFAGVYKGVQKKFQKKPSVCRRQIFQTIGSNTVTLFVLGDISLSCVNKSANNTHGAVNSLTELCKLPQESGFIQVLLWQLKPLNGV